MANRRRGADSSDEEEDEAHIPSVLCDSVITLIPTKARSGNIPTVFVGILHGSFTNDLWKSHKKRMRELFNISDNAMVMEIKVQTAGPNSIDSAQLERDTNWVIRELNRFRTTQLRIVGLGTGNAIPVSHAVESLIAGWNIPSHNKEVFFAGVGESSEYHYLNFCKTICMKELCKSIQYYNTMDFTNFGRLDRNRFDHGESKQQQAALAQGLGRLMLAPFLLRLQQ